MYAHIFCHTYLHMIYIHNEQWTHSRPFKVFVQLLDLWTPTTDQGWDKSGKPLCLGSVTYINPIQSTKYRELIYIVYRYISIFRYTHIWMSIYFIQCNKILQYCDTCYTNRFRRHYACWTFKVLVCSWVFIDHEAERYFLNE